MFMPNNGTGNGYDDDRETFRGYIEMLELTPVSRTREGAAVMGKLHAYLNHNRISYNSKQVPDTARAASDIHGIWLKEYLRGFNPAATELFHEGAHRVWSESHKRPSTANRCKP